VNPDSMEPYLSIVLWWGTYFLSTWWLYWLQVLY